MVIVLLATFASVGARPALGAVQESVPSVTVRVRAGSVEYSVESGPSPLSHLLQQSTPTLPVQATRPEGTHEVVPGESVHIIHRIENQAVTVTIEITVNVGEGATVMHTTDVHPPGHEAGRVIRLPVYLPTE